MKRFARIVENGYKQGSLEAWVKELWENLDGNPQDIDLVEHTREVFLCFEALPEGHQRAGKKMFSTMARGMAQYIERFSSGHIALESVEDLKQYCYYVAGVVGEFLCESFLLTYKIEDCKVRVLKEHCVAFGLGLQMTNIAKDIFKDRQRGQRFLPESFLKEAGLKNEDFLETQERQKMFQAYKKLLQEAYVHLQRGYLFTKSIHWYHVRLRLFCLWPLWMAFETLKTLNVRFNLLYSDRDVKISRSQIKRILITTTLMATSNTLLEQSFSRRYQNIL